MIPSDSFMFSHFSSSFVSTTILFFVILASFTTNSYAAKVYRWVDDKGNTHFSESIPRETKAETLNVTTAGKGSLNSADASAEDKKNSKEKKTVAEKTEPQLMPEVSKEDKNKYCQQSRDLLQQMNGNVQRRFEQPDGSYRKLTQEEILEYKTQAQTGMKDYCQ
jgi:hypothetical protein